MIQNRVQKKFFLNLLNVFLLLISFTAICYEPDKQAKRNNQKEKLNLGRVTGSLPDGLSLEFGSDIIIKNHLEGQIQRIDRRNKQIIINDDIFVCDTKVKIFSTDQKKVRFRDLKKNMLVRIEFEISSKGLLAKRIDIQNKTKINESKNFKPNERKKKKQSKPNYGSY